MALKISRAKQTLLGVSHARAPIQERDLAKKLGARTTKASGSKHEKGDVRKNGVYRVECKTTINKSYPLTRETFYKLASAASGTGEIPIMNIEFLNERGAVECELAVLPMEDLIKLLNGS